MRQRLGLAAAAAVAGALAALTALPAGAQSEPGLPRGSAIGAPSTSLWAREGYFIWADGDRFHVRWTAIAVHRLFSGEIISDGGIRALILVGAETGEVLRRGGNTVTWRARTVGTEGFDFTLAESSGWVRFALSMDGRLASPGAIFIGHRGTHPPDNPFFVFVSETGGGGWPPHHRGQPPFFGFGYYIWHDGDEWHIRWQGRGWGRLSGLVSTDGRFHEVGRVRLEGDDLLARGRGLIAWEASASGDADGVDFRTTGRRLHFTLLVNGAPISPNLIFIGAGGTHPGANPYTVTR
ncbi:MAG: hypothetical protein QN120_01895 [Armatimonadota bacterium]|nr:hypothetical protein [Armatimonadota bacterium]